MPKTAPCLWFDGQAEAAANHYVVDLPELEDPDDRSPTAPTCPATPSRASTMVVSFSLDGQEYVGLNGGPQFTFSEAISFQIHCADQDEVDRYWERLTEGGEEGPCGWLKDKFGVSWQVVPTRLLELIEDDDKARAQRATQAMLKMRKIDIAEVERAADGVTA